MAKKREPVDDVLDAIVWMRRKSKKREAVDDFIDALFTMRRKTAKKVKKTKHAKTKQAAQPIRKEAKRTKKDKVPPSAKSS